MRGLPVPPVEDREVGDSVWDYKRGYVFTWMGDHYIISSELVHLKNVSMKTLTLMMERPLTYCSCCGGTGRHMQAVHDAEPGEPVLVRVFVCRDCSGTGQTYYVSYN